FDEVRQLVRAKGVRFGHAAPVGIDPYDSLVERAETLAPVVLVGEAAAGPTDVRHLERLQRADNVVADAARIRDCGIRTDPDPLVNAVAEVFGELAEDVAVDLRSRLGRVNRQMNLLRCHAMGGQSESDRTETDQK